MKQQPPPAAFAGHDGTFKSLADLGFAVQRIQSVPSRWTLCDTLSTSSLPAPHAAARAVACHLMTCRILLMPGEAEGAPGAVEARIVKYSGPLTSLLRTLQSLLQQHPSLLAHVHASRVPSALAQAGRPALSLLSTLDSLYMELFTRGLHGEGGGAGLPCPTTYLQALLALGVDSEGDTPPALPAVVKSNPLQAYLQLRAQEGVRLCLPSLYCRTMGEGEGPTPGPHEGTMRGTDPCASQGQREWWDAGRDRVAAWASFACPSDEALHAILAFAAAEGSGTGAGRGRIVEVGAGTGYWALQLQQAARAHSMSAVRIDAYDKRPPGSAGPGAGNEYHGRMPCWTRVEAGGAREGAEAAGKAGATLLLCYPPPGVDAMGWAAVQAYGGAGGRRLVLVGEWRGDTGSARMEAEIHAGWELVQLIQLPNWPHTVANVTLWRPKGAPSSVSSTPVTWPLSCLLCGKCPTSADRGQWGRDRITRAVVVCSTACAGSARAREALQSECIRRQLPPLHGPEGASGGQGQEGQLWTWEGAGWTCGQHKHKSVWRWGPLLTS